MKYFDETDPVEVALNSRSQLLITNHRPGSEYDNLKFSVRQWFGIPLRPGKGLTLRPEDVPLLLKGLVEAMDRANIEFDETMWDSLDTLLQICNREQYHEGQRIALVPFPIEEEPTDYDE